MTDSPRPVMKSTGLRPGHVVALCGGKLRQGEGTCRKQAGWGTPHKGVGRCRLHGGNTSSHVVAGQRAMASAQVARLGLPREVDPHQALLEEVHRCAGAIEWLGLVVGDIEAGSLVWGTQRSVTDGDEKSVTDVAAINVWVRLWQDERDRLVRACKAAIDAGVDVRRVELEQARVSMQADGIRAGMDAVEMPEEVRRVFVGALLARLRVVGQGEVTS